MADELVSLEGGTVDGVPLGSTPIGPGYVLFNGRGANGLCSTTIANLPVDVLVQVTGFSAAHGESDSANGYVVLRLNGSEISPRIALYRKRHDTFEPTQPVVNTLTLNRGARYVIETYQWNEFLDAYNGTLTIEVLQVNP